MIDSQPYWQDAQLEVLPELGVAITRQDTIDTMGMRINQIVRACSDEWPWNATCYRNSSALISCRFNNLFKP